MMKRLLAVLLCAVLCWAAVLPAFAEEADVPGEEASFFISFYNVLAEEYWVENQPMSFSGDVRLYDTLELLKESGLIADYYSYENEPLWISFFQEEGDPVRVESNSKGMFAVRRNGVISTLEQPVREGDIVEWLCCPPEMLQSSSQPEEPVPSGGPSDYWSESAAQALTSGGDWLEQHITECRFYIVAMGSIGRTANAEKINSFLQEIKQSGGEEELLILAENVLRLSFCGYDGANAELSSLLMKLMQAPGLEESGARGGSYLLYAYDCRKYSVPNSAANSRDQVISFLLSLQNGDGGFGSQKGMESDPESTALILTALSGYSSRTEVAEALETGVEYLAGAQLEEGGFAAKGEEEPSAEILARVLTALSSLGRDIGGERFTRQGKSLLDQLLLFQNMDGGFSVRLETPSSASVTEQAVIALSSVKRNRNPYHISSSTKNSIPSSGHTMKEPLQGQVEVPPVAIAAGAAALAAAIGGAAWGIRWGIRKKRSHKSDLS